MLVLWVHQNAPLSVLRGAVLQSGVNVCGWPPLPNITIIPAPAAAEGTAIYNTYNVLDAADYDQAEEIGDYNTQYTLAGGAEAILEEHEELHHHEVSGSRTFFLGPFFVIFVSLFCPFVVLCFPELLSSHPLLLVCA